MSPTQEKKLFPIFRPKGERKTLYIIRHGESEFNAATNTGKGFSDPQIYDPKLTAKGQSQVSFHHCSVFDVRLLPWGCELASFLS